MKFRIRVYDSSKADDKASQEIARAADLRDAAEIAWALASARRHLENASVNVWVQKRYTREHLGGLTCDGFTNRALYSNNVPQSAAEFYARCNEKLAKLKKEEKAQRSRIEWVRETFGWEAYMRYDDSAGGYVGLCKDEEFQRLYVASDFAAATVRAAALGVFPKAARSTGGYVNATQPAELPVAEEQGRDQRFFASLGMTGTRAAA